MSEFKFKLKNIYVPFILLSLGLFTFCNLLRYLLDFKLGILNISKSLTEFWIPFTLPIIPIFFWFNKKARLLKFKNYNRYLNYLAFASLLVAFPIVISQKQIKKIVFKIIEIENPEGVRKYPNERFFRIKKYNVLKNNLCESTKYVKSNKKYRGGSTDAKTYLVYANKFENSESIWHNKASENVFIGNFAGATSHKTQNSLLIGYHTGVNSRGYGNVVLGNYAGGNIQGENNVIIGKAAAQGKLGDRNIVIGTHAGRKHGDFSNKLIIESSESTHPLIYGDFKTDKLDVNADLKIDGSLIMTPTSKIPNNSKEGTIYYNLKTKKLM